MARVEELAIPSRLLVLGMASADGTVRAERLYGVAEAAGLQGQQVRLTLRRLVDEGVYRQEGRGRAAIFMPVGDVEILTAVLSELEFVPFAYDQDAGIETWDGRWHLPGFSVAERHRAQRRSINGDDPGIPVHHDPNKWIRAADRHEDGIGQPLPA